MRRWILEPRSLGYDALWFDVESIGDNVPGKLVCSILKVNNLISVLVTQVAVLSDILFSTYQITRRHKAVVTMSV
jgi:hypothetical protein